MTRSELIEWLNNQTMPTNPDLFHGNEKFIMFMGDKDGISAFGRWEFTNGFNTALASIRGMLEESDTDCAGFQTPCDACMNNPKNGGSGICHCTLGQVVRY